MDWCQNILFVLKCVILIVIFGDDQPFSSLINFGEKWNEDLLELFAY